MGLQLSPAQGVRPFSLCPQPVNMKVLALLAAVIVLAKAQTGGPLGLPDCATTCGGNCNFIGAACGFLPPLPFIDCPTITGICSGICQQGLCPCVDECNSRCTTQTTQCRAGGNPLVDPVCDSQDFLCRGVCSTRCLGILAFSTLAQAGQQIQGLLSG